MYFPGSDPAPDFDRWPLLPAIAALAMLSLLDAPAARAQDLDPSAPTACGASGSTEYFSTVTSTSSSIEVTLSGDVSGIGELDLQLCGPIGTLGLDTARTIFSDITDKSPGTTYTYTHTGTGNTGTPLAADTAYWVRGNSTSGSGAWNHIRTREVDTVPDFGAETVANQAFKANSTITDLTLPAATGGNGALTYALTPALPAGLSFDASTRILSGTPTASQAETKYTYKVTDADMNVADSDADTLTFTITVTWGCSGSTAVGGATVTSGGLVDDCRALLASEATLAGTSTALNWDTGTAMASWTGVALENSRVTVLDLNSRLLTGSIPAALGELSALQDLRLYSNSLSGSIPAELENLSNLQILLLADNTLTGSIPAELGSISSLRHLRLQTNRLTGSIPSELGNLSNLVSLHLHVNSLEDSIPAELGNLSNLEELALYNNQLGGPIPASLGNLAKLTGLWLHVNMLEGSIPSGLENLANLQNLYLTFNSLTGCIPAGLRAPPGGTFLINSQRSSVNLPVCPGVPVLMLTPGNGQIAAAWTAPAGGTPTDYDLEYKLSSATAWTDAGHTGTGTAATIGSLTNDSEYSVRVRANTATDTGDWSVTAMATPTAMPTATGPDFGTATVADQSYALNTAITDLTLPAATGGNGTLTYALSPALPAGLTLNAATRTLSGTPTTGQAATAYTWSATDADGNADWLTFRIAVAFGCAGTTAVGGAASGGLVDDCQALLASKEKLVASGTPILNDWSTGTAMADWTGVTVSDGRVTTLDISNEGSASRYLTGTIPVELGDLTSLTSLLLNDNALTGSIPAALGNLSNLTTLRLNNNALTGSIPEELGSLASLIELRLTHNSLTGCIPPSLGWFAPIINPQKNSVNLPVCLGVPELTLTAGDAEIGASWTVPFGGTPTGYDLEYKLASATPWTDAAHAGTATTATIASLTNDSEYNVRVRAKTATDTGDWSATASATPTALEPEISTVAFASTPKHDANNDGTPDTFRRDEHIDVTVTWNKDVSWDTSATGAEIRLRLTVGANVRSATLVAGGAASGTARSLTFRYTVVQADTDTDGVAVTPASDGAVVDLHSGATLRDAENQNAGLDHAGLAADANRKVDGSLSSDDAPPEVSSASVDGTVLKISFNESLAAAESLSNDAFAVKKTPAGGSETNVSFGTAAPAISGSTVTLTLAAADAVTATDTSVKVSYSKPTTGSDNKLRDDAGNEVPTFSDLAVTNFTGTMGGPAFSPADGATIGDAGTDITLVFPEAIRKDAQGGDFSGHSDLSGILTLKTASASGTDIAYSASINGDRNIVTIDPSSDLAHGDVFVAVSNGYFDAAGNQGVAANATFTVDTTPPTVSGATVNGNTLILTFNEDLAAADGLPNTAFTVKLTRAGTEIDVSPTYFSPEISGKTVTLYLDPGFEVRADETNVKVSYAKPGTGTNNKLTDAVGNEVESFADQAVANNTPPAFSSASVNGTTLTITFDKDLAAAANLANGAFAVKRTREGTESTLSLTGTPSIDGKTVTLTIAAADRTISTDTRVRVSYTKPTAGSDNTLRDAAGIEVESFANGVVTNDTVGAVSSVEVSSAAGSDNTYAIGDTIGLKATFTESVTVTTVGTPVEGPRIAFTLGTETKHAVYVSGTGSAELMFGYTVAEDDEDTDGIQVAADALALNGGAIADAALNAAVLAHAAVAASASHKVDGVRPTVESATISGDTLVLTYDETLGAATPVESAFTVSAGADATTLADVNLAGTSPVTVSGTTVTLKLANPVAVGATVQVSYTAPATGAKLQDALGNPAGNLSGQAVTNNTATPTVTIASDATFPTRDAFTVTFAFSVAVADFAAADITVTNGAASDFSGSGTDYTATVTPTAGVDGEVAVSVAAGAVTVDGVGNAAASAMFAVDTRAPALDATNGPAVSGNTLVLTYDETLGAATPVESAFTVSAGADATTLATVALAATAPVTVSGTTVTLKLASAVAVGATVQVSYTAPATGAKLQDALGNPADNLSGQTVTNNTAALTVTIASDATFPIRDAFTVTFAFSVAVTDFAAADITVTNGAASGFSGSGTAYTATVTPDAGVDGNVTVTVPAGAATVDGVGNAAASAMFAVDTRAPALAATGGATISGDTLVLTYDEPLGSATPVESAFTVSAGADAANLTAVSLAATSPVTVSGATVTLKLAGAVAVGATVQVSYTAPATGAKLQDALGNPAGNLSGQAVTNNTVPTVTGVAVDDATGTVVTLTFDSDLKAMTATQLTELKYRIFIRGAYDLGIRIPGLGPEHIEISGRQLILRIGSMYGTTEILPGRAITVSYDAGSAREVGAELEGMNGGAVESFTTDPVTRTATDAIAPVLTAAETEGTMLTLTFDRDLDADSAPAGRRFSVVAEVVYESVRRIAGTGTAAVSGKTVTVTLASAVMQNEKAYVSYRKGDDAKPLRGTAVGPEVTDIVGFLYTTVRDKTVPKLLSADLAGKTLALYYDEPLDGGSTPETDAFTVTAGGATQTVSGVSMSESAVTLTLSASVTAGTAVTVGYTKPATGTNNKIRDAAGNDAANLSGQTVTNHGPEDTAAPTLASAAARLGVLTLTYDKPLDPAHVPEASAFTLSSPEWWAKQGVTLRSVNGVAVRGEKVELGLRGWVHPCSEAFTITYEVPATGALRSVWGQQAGALTEEDVTIQDAHRCVAVSVVRMSAEESGGTTGLSMKFDRALSRSAAPDAEGFSVQSDGRKGAVVVEDVGFPADPAGLTLTLGRALAAGERLTVSYRQPRSGAGLKDADGNQVAPFSVDTVVGGDEPSAPAVADVAITSSPADGDTYALGETIRVTLTFSEAVDVDASGGTPQLAIDMDPADWGEMQAAYVSGSGTAELVFAHRVVEPNSSSRGVAVLADTLALNGGAIRSQATGAEAVLSHVGLAHDPAHKVDWSDPLADVTPPASEPPSSEPPASAPPPAVTGVRFSSAPASGDTYRSGETIRVAVTFDGAVDVDTSGGRPRLTIDMDPADWGEKQAAYASGSGTAVLVFAHRVVEPNLSSRGVAVLADTLALNGGAIRSQATGAEAVLSHAGLAHDPAHKVDWRDPLADVTPPAPERATVNGWTATVTFDEELVAVGDNPLRLFFDVTGNGLKQWPTQVTVSGRTVTMRLGSPARAGHAYTLGYIGIPLADAAGNAVASFRGMAMENLTLPVLRPPYAPRAKEGVDATLDFEVTLDATAAGTVTVDYATVDGTAKAGEDYTAASGTLTFGAGETSQTVQVAILDDAHDEGEETVWLQLSNPSGATLAGNGQAAGIIENSDPMPNAWLARFGRTASAHVAGALAERFRGESAGTHPSSSRFILGGRRVDGLFEARAPADGGRGRDSGDTLAPRLEDEAPRERMDRIPAGGSNASGSPSGASPPTGRNPSDGRNSSDGRNPDGRSSSAAGKAEAWMLIEGLLDAAGWQAGQDLAAGLRLADGLGRADWRDVLAGSSFEYARAMAPGSESAFGLSRWSAWGHGARTRFSGADGPLSVTGDVTTATLGADARWDRWTAGLALAHSLGQGAYAAATAATAAGGAVESTLTSLNPYAHVRINGRTSLWGVLGYGAGELTLAPETAEAAIETDLGNAMAAFGGRGVFARRTGPDGGGGFELAVVSDALLTNTASEAATGLVGAEGRASRVRLILEGSGSMPLWNGGTLSPVLEAGLRYDGGDAETGAGVEIGGGLSYAAGRVSVDVQARAVIAHEDTDYEEWGFSGSVKWQPSSDGRGFSMNLGSSWGQAASGVRTLWDGRPGAGFGAGMARGAAGDPARRLQTEFGYGFQRREGQGLWTPFLAAESGDGHTAYRLGLRLDSAANAEAAFEIGRRASPAGPPGNAFSLEGRLRW